MEANTTTNSNTTNNTERAEIVERPTYYGQKGRALVWYWRAVSAYNLAAMIDGEEVTAKEYEKARKLLDSCQRYALADAHQWERANTYERYANSMACKLDEARNDRRRDGLQKRLARYGVRLENYGLYPSIIYTQTRERVPDVQLHYFD